MTPDLRRLLLDVILLNGEQDAAPSLGDMAKRAKASLDAETKGPRAGGAITKRLKAAVVGGFRTGWMAAWMAVAQKYEAQECMP